VIAYARVSSREQAENSAALDRQIARLKAAGAELVLADTRPLAKVLFARGGKRLKVKG